MHTFLKFVPFVMVALALIAVAFFVLKSKRSSSPSSSVPTPSPVAASPAPANAGEGVQTITSVQGLRVDTVTTARPSYNDPLGQRIVFDPGAYTDAGARLAAYQALQAKVGLRTPIYAPSGNKVDVRGDEIVPVTDGRDINSTQLSDFGVWVHHAYEAGKPVQFDIVVPSKNFPPNGKGIQLVWGDGAGQVAANVTATVSGPAGSFAGGANEHNGRVDVPGAKPGERYTAMVAYSAAQVGALQINPL